MSQGNELEIYLWGKISNFCQNTVSKYSPRIQIWALFQELAGVHCMEGYVLPI